MTRPTRRAAAYDQSGGDGAAQRVWEEGTCIHPVILLLSRASTIHSTQCVRESCIQSAHPEHDRLPRLDFSGGSAALDLQEARRSHCTDRRGPREILSLAAHPCTPTTASIVPTSRSTVRYLQVVAHRLSLAGATSPVLGAFDHTTSILDRLLSPLLHLAV